MTYLVAFDGSDEAENALANATTVADAFDSSVTVVYAAEPAVSEEGGTDPTLTFAEADEHLVAESLEDAEERGLDILDRATALAEELGHDVETELLYGAPVPAIADYAESVGAEGIFVGHRGRSERAELLVGSVAKGLVERATVSVTVVR